MYNTLDQPFLSPHCAPYSGFPVRFHRFSQVFTTQRGAITARAIQALLADIGKRARIQKMTPHMARHTFAKNLVNSGVTLEKVAMLLGHVSLDTTMVYTTPALSDLDQAVRVLDG